MNLLLKFKETVFSVLPVMAIVLVLGLTVAPLGTVLILRFVMGGILLILGLTFFLQGVDVGIEPIGENTGAALVKKKNLFLLLIVSFLIGLIVTVAEPDIQVFGDQISNAVGAVNKTHFVLMIAGGVGLFIVLGLIQSVLRLSYKILILICYTVVFTLSFFTPEIFKGIAFDSGGATTGPMTVPFILALGVGVYSVRSGSSSEKKSDSFGLTGITSIGPIFAVLVYGIILSTSGKLSISNEVAAASSEPEGLEVFVQLIPEVLRESFMTILPLAGMLFLFQFFLLHLSPRQLIRIFIGLVWSFIGLSIFLLGVKGGFLTAGYELGLILGKKAFELSLIWKILLVFTGLLLGAVVVCAEPAVWVLTEQVESLSGGTIKKKLLLVFLSIGAATAIGLIMIRSIFDFNIMYILAPGYAISMLLMIFCPSTFTAIAFDSGGVASGPITSTFVLSFTLGAGSAFGGVSSFGVIALVAMAPLIAIQILGIIYNIKAKKIQKEVEKCQCE